MSRVITISGSMDADVVGRPIVQIYTSSVGPGHREYRSHSITGVVLVIRLNGLLSTCLLMGTTCNAETIGRLPQGTLLMLERSPIFAHPTPAFLVMRFFSVDDLRP